MPLTTATNWDEKGGHLAIGQQDGGGNIAQDGRSHATSLISWASTARPCQPLPSQYAAVVDGKAENTEQTGPPDPKQPVRRSLFGAPAAPADTSAFFHGSEQQAKLRLLNRWTGDCESNADKKRNRLGKGAGSTPSFAINFAAFQGCDIVATISHP